MDIDDDPRSRVIDDLLDDIELSIQNGCSIILMSDLNEHANSREKTNKRLYTLGLHNIMQDKLGTAEMPRTHKRGSSAIDHVWVTAALLPAIAQAGFAPFDFLGSSDHRGICFDVDLEQLLDFNVIPLQNFPHRRLQSKIPKRVQKYIEKLENQWKLYNIDERLREINDKLAAGDISTLEHDLNKLDQSINDAMKHAEKKCCGVPGNVSSYWSPTYHKALQALHDTRKARNRAQYVTPGGSIVDAVTTFKKAQDNYTAALKHYREVKGKNVEVRKLDITKLAEDRAEAEGTSTSVEYKKILTHESECRSHRKIKYVVKPNHRAGVHSILIPAREEYNSTDPNFDHLDVTNMWRRITPHNGKDVNAWERITDKAELERILLRWQQLHFLQANDTPLSSEEWKQQFNDQEFQEAVVHGTYVPPVHLHPTTRDVLLHFQKDNDAKEIEFSTTF